MPLYYIRNLGNPPAINRILKLPPGPGDISNNDKNDNNADDGRPPRGARGRPRGRPRGRSRSRPYSRPPGSRVGSRASLGRPRRRLRKSTSASDRPLRLRGG